MTHRLAIQEDMLPGSRLADRFARAADLGIQGIEFWSSTLTGQVDDIQRLTGRGGVTAAISRRNHFVQDGLPRLL
jgi:hypothetical protein